MDTLEIQMEYPQLSGQKPGCGFPVMGVVGVLDLSRGSIDSYVECKHTDHDANGAWRLRDEFSRGDIVIADRAFCSCELMATLLQNGVQSVMRLHQKRQGRLEAVRGEAVCLDELAFKDTLDVLNEFRSGFEGLLAHPRLLAKERQNLEERIAERTLLIRPGRSEPRAVKLRPKPYQYLTAPRREFTEIFHRSKYEESSEKVA